MAIDGVKPTGTPGGTVPLKKDDSGQVRNWGMTGAIREEGCKGGEAVSETPLRAYGLLENEKVASSSSEATPAESAAAAAEPKPTKDKIDKNTSLRVNAVLNAAAIASGQISGTDAAFEQQLDKAAEPPAPPPPKPKKKKKGCAKVVGAVVDAVTGIVKGIVKFVKAAIAATISIIKSSIKMAMALAKGDLKGAAEEFKAGLKEVWKHTKEALKGLGEVITSAISLLEATVPGFKLVTDFMKSSIGQKIIMALGILAMIPPLTAVLGPVMLAIALYQGAQMVGQGLQNGNLKMAAMGILTVAASVVGLRGAVGGASAAATSTAQKTLNIASNSLKAVDAASRGDWKGAIMAGASAGAAAGGSATAQQVANVATKGVAAVEAAKNKDWLAVAAAGAAVGAAGLALASMETDDSKPKNWVSQKYDDAKKWVGEKLDAFADSAVGKVVLAPVNWVKAGLDKGDQYLFGTKLPDGTREPDGLVTKAGEWWNENVQKPVANAFAPVKTALSDVSKDIDKGVADLKDPLVKGASAVDKAAYGADGKSGAFGAIKDGVTKGFDPLKDAAEKGSAAVRDGVADLSQKAADAIGAEPKAPVVAGGPSADGPAAPPPLGTPDQAADAVAGPEEEPGALAKAWNWMTGKAAVAQTNAQNIAGKVEAVTQDVNKVQNDVAAKLAEINKAHDTFMAGVETVRAVGDGDAKRALRAGGTVLGATGYADLGTGMQTLANRIDDAERLEKAIKEEDLATGLEAIGNFTGLQDIAATGQKINQAKRVAAAAESGNTANLIYEAGRLVESKETVDLANRLAAAEAAERSMEAGDTASALGYLGQATGSKAIGATGETLRDAQNAKLYAEQGQYGNALGSLGRAAGNKNMQDLGGRVDSAEVAANNLQGKDRYGNKLDAADATASFLTNAGLATNSKQLQTGGRITNKANAANKAINRGDQSAANRAAAEIMTDLDREQAQVNLNKKAEELDERIRLASLLGAAADEGRVGDLVEGVAATQGMKAQQLDVSKDAKDFEAKAQKFGKNLTSAEKLGKKLTGQG